MSADALPLAEIDQVNQLWIVGMYIIKSMG